MGKLFHPFIFVTALLLAACNSSEEPNDPMHWSFVNSSPDGIKCDSTLTGGVPQIYLMAHSKGGSVESYLHVTRTFGDMNPDDEE